MSKKYHILIEDETGEILIDEERETFIYGSPLPGTDSQFSFTSKIDVLKVFGPLIMKLMKNKFIGG